MTLFDHPLAEDIQAVRSIRAVPTILDIVCRTTGMRFAAVARVTEERWVACSVRDDIAFGLAPGGELKLESTICDEIRQSGTAVIIDHVAEDPCFASHHTPLVYGFQSYISMPIRLDDGSFFGTLCAIDPEPRRLNNAETVEMFEMFAEIIGLQLSAIDRLKHSEANLLDERNTAALREQFIAVLGHDMRNPLAAIDGGMQLLLRTALTDKAIGIVHLVQGSVRRAVGLVDDLMDFARGRLGGGIALSREMVPIEPTLRQVLAEQQTMSPDRVIETSFTIDAPLCCDRQRIGQLLSNLLGNAITHGAPDWPVRVAASTTQAWFELSVANAGDPIPPGAIDVIFEPFSRGTHRPSQQGLGLGLYISHQVARAHGGELSVVSTPEETCFTFRMPLAAPEPAVREAGGRQ